MVLLNTKYWHSRSLQLMSAVLQIVWDNDYAIIKIKQNPVFFNCIRQLYQKSQIHNTILINLFLLVSAESQVLLLNYRILLKYELKRAQLNQKQLISNKTHLFFFCTYFQLLNFLYFGTNLKSVVHIILMLVVLETKIFGKFHSPNMFLLL